ncbi:MAG TPA: aspartate aminotransferase family protein [Anaerolineae bacterium]|nr:aspartate aminotransferase family protein [Anaerolineae bacterium]
MDPTLEKIYHLSPQDIQQAEKHIMVGGGTPGPILFRGKGIRIEDIHGKSYIDCTSQSWAMYLGFANPEINRIVCQHLENISHIHQGFHSLPRLYLAKKLTDIAPKGIDRVSFAVGGGLAVEAAMKIALRNRPGAKCFITLWDAYHGSTFTASSMSWISTKANGKYTGQQHFIGKLEATVRVPNPYCYRCFFKQSPDTCDLACAEMLRETIIRGITGPAAGFILEPIQASAGQIPVPKRYLQRVREICDEFEVPLIFDEIQTYCRIGEWFAAQYYGVTPDIIAMGKGLGAGFPIAAILINKNMTGFGPHVEELHTFANNSVSQVAAAKQIDIIKRDDLLGNTRRMGKYFLRGLQDLQQEFPQMGDIRAVGLHIGVEYVKDPITRESDVQAAKDIRQEGLKQGVIFGLGGAHRNVLKIKPPLIIKQPEADEVLDKLKKSMRAVLG